MQTFAIADIDIILMSLEHFSVSEETYALLDCYDPLARGVKGKQHKPGGIGKSKNIY